MAINQSKIQYGRAIVNVPDPASAKAASNVAVSNNTVAQTANALNQANAQIDSGGNGGGKVVTKSNMITPQMYHQFSDTADLISANNFPLPNVVTVKITSAVGAGAAATRVYIFNQDILKNVTNNGSGAASIAYTYLDNFAGNNISQLMALSRAGIGAIIYGFTLRMNVTAGGAGDATGLGVCNPYFATNNAYGNELPLNANMTANQTRGDFDTSIEGNDIRQNMGRFVQFSFIIPVGDSVIFTGYLTPDYKQ